MSDSQPIDSNDLNGDTASEFSQRAWLTFEDGKQKKPCLWQMSRRFPEVSFDIRQTQVTDDIGIMNVLFEGDEDEVVDAIAYLRQLGVKVDTIADEG